MTVTTRNLGFFSFIVFLGLVGCEKTAPFKETVLQDCDVRNGTINLLVTQSSGRSYLGFGDGPTRRGYHRTTLLEYQLPVSGGNRSPIKVSQVDISTANHDTALRFLRDKQLFLSVGVEGVPAMTQVGTFDLKTGREATVCSLPRWHERYPKLEVRQTIPEFDSSFCTMLDNRTSILVWNGRFREFSLSNRELIETKVKDGPGQDGRTFESRDGVIVFPDDSPRFSVARIHDGYLEIDGARVMGEIPPNSRIWRVARRGTKWRAMFKIDSTSEFVFVDGERGELARVVVPILYEPYYADLWEGVAVFAYPVLRDSDVAMVVYKFPAKSRESISFDVTLH